MSKRIDFNDYLNKQPNGCWLWTKRFTHDGYAVAGTRYVHREVYEYYKGKIPPHLTLDHLCRVRHCCNPDHLEPVTLQENISRGNYGWRSKLTHCKQGHEFTPENTIIRPTGGRNGGPRRDCRECGRIAQRAYQHRKKNDG
jgi:hypothetical protein